MSELIICPACERHVRAGTARCPFCGSAEVSGRSAAPRSEGQPAPPRIAALALGAALAAGGCSSNDPQPAHPNPVTIYGGPPVVMDAGSADGGERDAGVPDQGPRDSGGGIVPAYGAPPVPLDAGAGD